MYMSALELEVRKLAEFLGALIEGVDKLPASPERNEAVRDLVRHWNDLNAIVEGQRATTLH